MLVTTVAGIGYLRPASGTWASVATLILAALMWLLLTPAGLLLALSALTVLATFVGLAAAPAAIRQFGRGDPSQVVIDEVAGQALALTLALALAPTALGAPALTGFLALALFRVFDIAKPWPISLLERLPAGWGIMFDDLGAGLCSGLLTAAAVH